MRTGPVRIGTSGYVYKHWRGVFYPPDLPARRWFGHYAAAFDTVEVNNTFYRLPGPGVFAEWARQAPPGFIHALKASRYLTHMKKLKDPAGPLDLLLGRARKLGPHLGPVLYQLPPHWHCDPARLRQFLALLPNDLSHAVEFRDPSWYTDEVRGLLAEYRVGFCVHDLRGEPSPRWVTGPLAYVRFHGPGRPYHDSYSDAQLRSWAGWIAEVAQSGTAVYAYFNNDNAGHAVANARALKELLHRRRVA